MTWINLREIEKPAWIMGKQRKRGGRWVEVQCSVCKKVCQRRAKDIKGRLHECVNREAQRAAFGPWMKWAGNETGW